MANIKEVLIEGEMAYDAGGSEALLKLLGQMNTPSFGLRISYDGRQSMIPNKWGGHTAMYGFTISGMEAVRDEWIEHLLASLSLAAKVTVAKYRDYENNTPWWDVREYVQPFVA